MERTIAVGSGTGLKLQAVAEVFPECKVIAVPVKTGVREQPIGYHETRQGAINRAHRTREAEPNAHAYFGIENGLVKCLNGRWMDLACIVCVLDDGSVIERWTDAVAVPDDWMVLALRNLDVTYVKHVKDRFPELKDVDLHDPHTFLTEGSRSRKSILVCAIKLIKNVMHV
jgi:non-canonical (house-cleaning) NTP pyrophosphatase